MRTFFYTILVFTTRILMTNAFEINNVSLSDTNSITLSWNSVGGRLYAIDASTSPQVTTENKIGEFRAAKNISNFTEANVDFTANPNRFYRIREVNEYPFDKNRLLEVELTLNSADWNKIRQEVRNEQGAYGPNCDQSPSNPFTYVSADITIDGTLIPNVGLRKKGWVTSGEKNKPSLKVKFDKYVDGVKFEGYKRLTLNNCIFDKSLIRQCLAFGVFEAAGIPTPKCNFAHVRVNGKDLGIYANVENVKKKFLRRYFDDDEGDFFEGTESDFRNGGGWVGRFSRQTNDKVAGYGRIPDIVNALEATDGDLIEMLNPLIELNQFLTFWATEVLVGHVDGYAGSSANFYIYDDPKTAKFQFIPWDLDYTFSTEYDNYMEARSVWANAQLVKRLYLLPEIRAQYFARLNYLLDSVWSEDHLNASIDGMEAVLGNHLTPDNRSEILKIREYINTLRSKVTAEITSGRLITPELLEAPCGNNEGEDND